MNKPPPKPPPPKPETEAEGVRAEAQRRLQVRQLSKARRAPAEEIVAAAEQYARDNKIPYQRQPAYVQVDPARAERIAAAYAAMPHTPNAPKVKEAYKNLIEQTTAQYQALKKAGFKFYLFDESNDPYQGNPWNAMRDLRANKTMGVFATEAGFGTGDFDPAENPLLADTGIKWPFGADGKPKRVLANDLFRAVHDAFGHGIEGAGFRADGEENAWLAHSQLFTGSALGAITTETRGQNSWLNYGPHGEKNRTAKVEDTVFAPQKTGLMPAWTWTEGSTNPNIRLSKTRKLYGNLTPDEQAAVDSVVANTDESLKQKMDKLRSNLGLRITQGMADQFASIKDVSMKAYRMARMAMGTDGALEAHMLYGPIEMTLDGMFDVKIDPEKGFAKVLADLGMENRHRFLLWVAALRAEQLKKEGKENLFTDKDISVLKGLNKGQEQKFAKALHDLNKFNNAILKIGVQAGLIDPEGYEKMKDQPYVPFYRLLQDEKAPLAAKFSNALTGQYASHKLKGGKSQLNDDLLANVMQNWSHVISASAKNRAAVEAIDAAMKLDLAYKVEAGTKNAVKVMRDGKAEYYSITDDYLHHALTAVHATLPSFMKPLAVAKRWMTVGVTANPAYRIRNILRDSISSVSQSELSYNIPKNMLQGLKASNRNSQTYASMLASGAIIKFGSMNEGNSSARLNTIIDKFGPKNTILDAKGFSVLSRMLKQTWDIYQDLGDKAENANRAALYEQLIAKGYSKADAAFAARDLLDFSLQGGWPILRFFTQSVPFLNARIQGLYKLGRAAKQDPQKFMVMAGAVAAASLALMLMYQDDDDWKQREDWDRDTYWWFKIGDHTFRVPKPFELGSLGTVFERSWELAFNKEMTGKRYRRRMAEIMSQQLAINPVPQLAKPLWDIYANKDSFTGRPIEGPSLQNLRPQDRATERTSAVAKVLGQFGLPDPAQLLTGNYKPLSPVQIDHAIRGYFGWAGTAAATMADEIGLRGAIGDPPRAERSLKEKFLIGNFIEGLPAQNSRYVTQLYERSKELEEVYASWRDAVARGDLELAKELGTKEMFLERGKIKGALASVTAANKESRKVQQAKDMTPAEKRERLDKIAQRRNQAAAAVQQ